MDFLSLTFRSLGLTNLETTVAKEQESFESTSGVVTTKEKSRRTKRNEESSRRELRSISLDEVAWHDAPDDCWIVVYDYVYDCTELLKSHPGGQDVLLEYAGRDATLGFIGAGHSKAARETLERYLIGELPVEQRIFRVPGGVRVVGF